LLSGSARALPLGANTPTMPDRLEELRHQRALVQEHLNWLEHEIAQVTVTRLTLPPFAMRPDRPGSVSRPPTPVPVPATAIPELSQFQVDPDDVHVDTRRGCFLYTGIALIIFVLVLAVIYFVGYRDRPVLFVPEKAGPTMVYPAGPPKTPAQPGKGPATPPPAKPASGKK